MEIAVDLAVITFNSGHQAWKGLLQRLYYELGPTLEVFLRSKDELRVWMAEYKQAELVKKRRRQMRLDRVMLDEEQVAAEGVTYSPGAF